MPHIIAEGFHGRDWQDIPAAKARKLLAGKAISLPQADELLDGYCPAGCQCGGPILALAIGQPGREFILPLVAVAGPAEGQLLWRIPAFDLAGMPNYVAAARSALQ